MRDYFDVQNEVREKMLELSREVIRNSSRSISATHRQEKKLALNFLTTAKKKLGEMEKIAGKYPQLSSYGYIHSAQQEYVEAEIIKRLSENGEIPSPKKLGVHFIPYLGGVSDAIGELRRTVLDMIRRNEVQKAEKTLTIMEELFEFLMEFDYVDAVIPGMRRRQDVSRQILEKTRGDLTTALRQEKLEKALRRGK